MIPGTQLLPNSLLTVVMFIFLMYLFLGIAIIADIFMAAIEVITSETKTVEVSDQDGKRYFYDVPIWNATIANLTLMALGSSAPEILLSIIGTVTTLGEVADELGPSTIVGSAAFNLMVISAVSIVAVDEPKKINDLGVFATTSVFSVFAYIWIYICLSVNTPDEVTTTEAWLTLIFFFVLVILAFAADKYNQRQTEKRQSKADLEEKDRRDELAIKKSHLRNLAKDGREQIVLSIAQGIHHKDAA